MYYMFHLTYESFVQYGSSNLKVLELTLGELQVSMYPSQGKKEEEKKNRVAKGGFISTFCLLLIKQDLNQSANVSQMPQKCNLTNKIL